MFRYAFTWIKTTTDPWQNCVSGLEHGGTRNNPYRLTSAVFLLVMAFVDVEAVRVHTDTPASVCSTAASPDKCSVDSPHMPGVLIFPVIF